LSSDLLQIWSNLDQLRYNSVSWADIHRDVWWLTTLSLFFKTVGLAGVFFLNEHDNVVIQTVGAELSYKRWELKKAESLLEITGSWQR
jgi:hypothetical protein